jgi:hypothetical protein
MVFFNFISFMNSFFEKKNTQNITKTVSKSNRCNFHLKNTSAEMPSAPLFTKIEQGTPEEPRKTSSPASHTIL